MKRTLRVLAAVLGGLAMAAAGGTGAAGTGGSAAASAAVPVSGQRFSGGPTGLERFYNQTLRWRPCRPRWAIASGFVSNDLPEAQKREKAQKAVAGFQCTRLTVPLNYAKPWGKTIKLAMNRLPASNPARRIGPLLTNPGGPGESGLALGFNARKRFTGRLRKHYDIVGMDPRGVGLSSPVKCKLTPEQHQQLSNPDQLVRARVIARACERSVGGLIPFVGTETAARDLDIARAVIGESQPAQSSTWRPGSKGSTGAGTKLDYFGVSYGTLLGQVYANMFPGNVGRMVLDSVDSPVSGVRPAAVAAGFQYAFVFMVRTCVARPACPMGSSEAAVLASFDALIRDLSSRGRARGVLDDVRGFLYNERTWPKLEMFLGRLFKEDLPGVVTNAAQPQGNPLALSSQEPELENHSYRAIFCLTLPQAMRTVAAAEQAMRAALAVSPLGDFVGRNWLDCAKWPVPSPPDAGKPIHAPGTPPILLVTNTVDPATPLAWAREVHAALANSILVTNVAGGHGFYIKGACTHRVVDDFLISATTPAPGTTCHDSLALRGLAVPSGAPGTGGGSTAGVADPALFGAGGAAVLAGIIVLGFGRRRRRACLG